MTTTKPAVRRVRRVSNEQAHQEPLLQEVIYRGFGSIRGETLDEFHDRMFDIPPLEAMMYEMEVALA